MEGRSTPDDDKKRKRMRHPQVKENLHQMLSPKEPINIEQISRRCLLIGGSFLKGNSPDHCRGEKGISDST